MKLVRYGRAGAEKPGLIDAADVLRDLSRVVKDITPDALSPAGLKRLRAANVARLPVVRGKPRLGCPLASQTLRDLQARLRETGLARQTALVTISFDPERDHPAQLAKYAKVYDADPAFWRFFAAPSGRVLDAVLESYGQDRTPERDEHGRSTGRIRHVLKVFLVDRDGFIRNVYSAGFLVPELVLNDIRTVLGAR